MIHRKNHHFLRVPCSKKMPGTCLPQIPQGLSTLILRRWSEVLSGRLVRGDSRRKNDLLHKDAMSVSQLLAVRIYPESETGRKQAQDPPGSLHTQCFVGGVKFPQGEGSAVIHRKKNDLLHKAATYMSVSQPLARPIHLVIGNRS